MENKLQKLNELNVNEKKCKIIEIDVHYKTLYIIIN